MKKLSHWLLSAAALSLVILAQTTSEATRFRAYLAADWKRWMAEYPEIATLTGFPGQNDRWTDNSPAGIERRKQHLTESFNSLKQIRRDALPESERLNFDLYWQLLEMAQRGLQYGDDPLPFPILTT